MRRVLAVLTVIATLVPASAMAVTTYVYCINDRIEVDQRNPNQMKSDRGHSTICIIGPTFDFGPDAVRWVEANLRSKVGGSCSCK
jgi:hypothetical protein